MSPPESSLTVAVRPPVEGAADPGAPTYLLVHGSMDRATSFRRLERLLPEATVVSYDRRGYAGSAGRAATAVFDEQVGDLLEVIDGRPVVALGHSFGGGVVLAAAVARPDLVRAAVVWEPPMPWLGWWPTTTAGAAVVADGRDPAEVAEAFMRRMVGDRIWERLPASTRQARREEGPALVEEMRSLRGELPWRAAAVGVPVIVGAGEDSSDHQRRAAAELAGQMPRSELVMLPGARHGAHLSHPAELAGLLRRAGRLADLDPPSLGRGGDGRAESPGTITVSADDDPAAAPTAAPKELP